MGRYAENTAVTVEKSRGEIESILLRYGATQFAYYWDEKGATIGFRATDRMVRFHLPLPPQDDPLFTHTPSRGNKRGRDAAIKVWEQSCRQLWRAMTLMIKAKLESVESGIRTFEQEFLSDIVLPDGRTVYEMTTPAIATAYETGNMPDNLLALPAPRNEKNDA